MTKTQMPRVTPQAGLGGPWTGWATFAAVIIALDVIVIYALTAHWADARAGLG
jgi:hypothetical protein